MSVRPQVCSVLVWSEVSAPYGIAGSTHELYTCLLGQMTRLILKISQCSAYAAQPAMIIRCISLSCMVLFLEAVAFSQVYVAFNIFYQHIVITFIGVLSTVVWACDAKRGTLRRKEGDGD